MISSPVVFLLAPSEGPVATSTTEHWATQLAQNGIGFERFEHAADLYARLGVVTPASLRVLTVLAANPLQNVMACSYVRGCWPAVPVACVMSSQNESDLAAVLDAGASLYLPPEAGNMLLLAVVRRLLALAFRPEPPPEHASGMADGGWQLLEWQSVAVSPSGERIILTTIERRVMQVLAAGPETGMSHDDLLQALGRGAGGAGHPEKTFGRARLSLVLSRLRRKFEKHGQLLPVVSVHGWGYQFTGRRSGP